jgi:nucleoside triphosphatase
VRRRVIVVPLIQNAAGDVLLCRMPPHRGVYPGQWGLAGGGVEADERIDDALRREAREELGLELGAVAPLFFTDAVREKRYPDGTCETLHMVFLVYRCLVADGAVRLNEEFDAYAWVAPPLLSRYDLNEATIDTLRRAGIAGIPSAGAPSPAAPGGSAGRA